ncbi:MAG: alpha amylase family protein [Candidatus Cryptobacteroides sp.]
MTIKQNTSLILAALLTAGTVFFASCDKGPYEYPWNSEWDKYDPQPEPEPEPDPDPTPEPGFKGKARYVWVSCEGNWEEYANDQARIIEEIGKIKKCGFTDLVVDVRPTNGGVLFKSTYAQPQTKMDCWTDRGYVFIDRTADFDYLQTFIDEGHKQGLRVNVVINTFVGGCLCPYGLGSDGMLFSDSSKKSWASVVNTSEGLKNTMDLLDDTVDYGAKFLSPANAEVQDYVLGIIGDLAKYDVDGIILDRCRFDDYSLQSDFSDASKAGFEEYIGRKVTDWPGEVMEPGQEALKKPVSDITKKWLEYRAKVIHDFVMKAADKVHSINPEIRFGCYVGGWYSSYYYSGVNWASPKYDPKADGYYWAGDNYKDFGYADHCDFMFIGAYASSSSIYGSGEWTMQGFCKQAADLFKGDVPFSGGPDIGNGSGFENGGKGSLMPDIVDACINSSTDGMFFFDLCHIRMYDYWDDIKKAFDKYLETVE